MEKDRLGEALTILLVVHHIAAAVVFIPGSIIVGNWLYTPITAIIVGTMIFGLIKQNKWIVACVLAVYVAGVMANMFQGDLRGLFLAALLAAAAFRVLVGIIHTEAHTEAQEAREAR